MDWENVDQEMLDFTRFVIGLRRRHPIFRRRKFFEGKPIAEWDKVPDISWLQPDAEPMTTRNWQAGDTRTLTVVLNGSALNEKDRFGRPQEDRSFALFFNSAENPTTVLIPGRAAGTVWAEVLDTAVWPVPALTARATHRAGEHRVVQSRSVVVLQEVDTAAS
jgi:glycogen operon protein